MAISELVELVPPPGRPFHSGSSEDWSAAEEAAGFRFPSDFKDFVRTYGTGIFGDYLYVNNPFKGLLPWAKSRIRSITPYIERENEYRRSMGCDPLPYTFYPQKGGLLPIGQEDNGNYVIHWRMDGDPDEWPIVVLFYHPGQFEDWEFQGPLTSFLASVFRSEFECEPICPQDDEFQFEAVQSWNDPE